MKPTTNQSFKSQVKNKLYSPRNSDSSNNLYRDILSIVILRKVLRILTATLPHTILDYQSGHFTSEGIEIKLLPSKTWITGRQFHALPRTFPQEINQRANCVISAAHISKNSMV